MVTTRATAAERRQVYTPGHATYVVQYTVFAGPMVYLKNTFVTASIVGDRLLSILEIMCTYTGKHSLSNGALVLSVVWQLHCSGSKEP